jgi:capsule polysaccharide export protein KpsE/RkpR
MKRETTHGTWNDNVIVRRLENELGHKAGDHAGVAPGRHADLATAPSAHGTEVQRAPSGKRVQRLTVATARKDQRAIEARKPREAAPPSLPASDIELPPLPAPDIKQKYGTLISFLVCVMIPILLAWIYYGAIASNQYASEFRFTVKDTSTGAASTSTGLLAMIAGPGVGTSTDNYLVADYLTSRQIVEDLQKRIRIIDLYSKPEIDWWSRFDSTKPMEQFVSYWQKMTSASFDMITGTAIARVRAFSPEDTLLIANTMVVLAEELVNQMSNRSREDAVRFAEKEVERAQNRLVRARSQLTDERQRTIGSGATNGSPPAAGSSLLLDLERQFAQSMLTSAMGTLDAARSSAASQHLYITPYIRPSLPRSSTYPRTLWSVMGVGAIAFAIWLTGLLVLRSIFERVS